MITVVIPAYKPDVKLPELVKKIKAGTPYNVLVVDDGSGAEYQQIFDMMRYDIVLLTHEINKGKGRAIKTALEYIQKNMPEVTGIVTADADGQHLPEDILHAGEALEKNPEALVIGRRKFDRDVPLRSRVGNGIDRVVFYLVTGVKVYDTQTGLRAFGVNRISEFTALKGERYELEMNVLLYAAKTGIHIVEVPISTVYIESNASSHFNVFLDSVRIYSIILKFMASSLVSFTIDLCVLLLLRALTKNLDTYLSLVISVVGAKIAGTLFNYTVNRKFVFRGKKIESIKRYYLVITTLLCLNYFTIWLLYPTLGIPLAVSKIITELMLYPINFFLQKQYVFKE